MSGIVTNDFSLYDVKKSLAEFTNGLVDKSVEREEDEPAEQEGRRMVLFIALVAKVREERFDTSKEERSELIPCLIGCSF